MINDPIQPKPDDSSFDDSSFSDLSVEMNKEELNVFSTQKARRQVLESTKESSKAEDQKPLSNLQAETPRLPPPQKLTSGGAPPPPAFDKLASTWFSEGGTFLSALFKLNDDIAKVKAEGRNESITSAFKYAVEYIKTVGYQADAVIKAGIVAAIGEASSAVMSLAQVAPVAFNMGKMATAEKRANVAVDKEIATKQKEVDTLKNKAGEIEKEAINTSGPNTKGLNTKDMDDKQLDAKIKEAETKMVEKRNDLMTNNEYNAPKLEGLRRNEVTIAPPPPQHGQAAIQPAGGKTVTQREADFLESRDTLAHLKAVKSARETNPKLEQAQKDLAYMKDKRQEIVGQRREELNKHSLNIETIGRNVISTLDHAIQSVVKIKEAEARAMEIKLQALAEVIRKSVDSAHEKSASYGKDLSEAIEMFRSAASTHAGRSSWGIA